MNSYVIAQKYKMLSTEEVDLIHKCAAQIPDDSIVVNIGLNVGTSLIAILEKCPNAYVYNVDKKPCPEAFSNVMDCGLSTQNVVLLQGDSTRLDYTFIDTVNLVFVDGGHDDYTLQSDIRNFKPKVPIGGFMLFHDYHHPNYAIKANVNLDEIVESAMVDWEKVGEARYLVAYKKVK